MREPASYTIDELAAETDTERRTISYYVQEGLLPRVGRRGPKTRYPKAIRDRLLFIKKLREIEDAGRIPNLTLAQIRDIFDVLSERDIARVADGEERLDAIVLGGTAGRAEAETFELAGDATQMDLNVAGFWAAEARDGAREDFDAEDEDESGQYAFAAFSRIEDSAPEEPGISGARRRRDAHRRARRQQDAERILDLLDEIQQLAQTDRHESTSEYISEPWTRVKLTADLVLSVRGQDRRLDQLLDRLARVIRGVLGKR